MYLFQINTNEPQLISQEELNDLIRKIQLSKNNSEILASFLKQRNLLQSNTSITYYRNRNNDIKSFFSKEKQLTFCNNVEGLLVHLNIDPNPENFRLFIDGSVRSLKAVILSNNAEGHSIPIGYSRDLKEKYETIKFLLNKVNYNKFDWKICVDLKMVAILYGLQGGYTTFMCFICKWNTRNEANFWSKNEYPKREKLKKGEFNIVNKPLVKMEKIIVPPLHIKIGLMTVFVKALDPNGRCVKAIKNKFKRLSEMKLANGIFNGSQIRKLFKDKKFLTSMTKKEKQAWIAFKSVSENFLGLHRAPNYIEIVENLLSKFKDMGCRYTLKVRFVKSYL